MPAHSFGLAAHFILWLAKHHVLPEAYLYGLVDMQVFGSQMTSFLFGKVHQGPTLPYFPMAFLMKSTLPVLLLVAALPFLRFRGGRPWRRMLFLAIPGVVFMGMSLLAAQNIGVRHILPVFPFVLLLAALAASTLALHCAAGAYAVGALLLLHVVSSVRTFPNYMAYGNEAIGGSSRTYRVLSDSNVDWGQGLIEVRSYIKKNHVTDCWFVPLGGEVFGHVSYYQIPCKPLPSSFEKVVGAPLPIIPETVHGTVLGEWDRGERDIVPGPGPLNPYGELFRRTPRRDECARLHSGLPRRLPSAARRCRRACIRCVCFASGRQAAAGSCGGANGGQAGTERAGYANDSGNGAVEDWGATRKRSRPSRMLAGWRTLSILTTG